MVETDNKEPDARRRVEANRSGSEPYLARATPKRFDVELFIVHPTIDPLELTRTLGLEANFVHRVGDQRKTPKGTLLPGAYCDTRWRHCRRYETHGQWFADEVAKLIDDLEPHKTFLRNLRATGGSACIVIQLLGDGYFGEVIDRSVLAKLVDLELDIGVESFIVPQSE
jgi:hypothetical protein